MSLHNVGQADPLHLACATSQKPLAFVHPLWPVLHVDNHLLAVYKPAGLLVQGDPSGDLSLLDLARKWIKERYKKPGNVFVGLVHRLDRPVSGLVLLARTSKAASRLSAVFRENRAQKIYLAVVEGRPSRACATLVHGLIRQESKSVAVLPVKTPGTQRAELHYRTVAFSDQRTLLAVHLKTGRKHQIRAQLAHEGCPIVGDVRYGAPTPLPYRSIALHAWKLTLPHPTKGEAVEISCPLPLNWPWSQEDMGNLSILSPFRPLWHWCQYEPNLT
ncbi:RluA family pseudouridine synthase [Desulfosoma caldarium]|uniref:23S rRNA pseudouridine1911/1915/1917 synthase n=1 Tax=Desulfosoma caldarium TaxID=610254 RepID=A0A3N1UFZ4_9BACT|nr:RNA pseudouridine synthase [Desulfosoma caldarium]ROQ90242.1 23S rRNA pseudouridine1911/1915/1917 synthase [Desulfosoma caldarium]